jgi:hypothetical protein
MNSPTVHTPSESSALNRREALVNAFKAAVLSTLPTSVAHADLPVEPNPESPFVPENDYPFFGDAPPTH